jgi:hypothetical protein
MIKLNWKQGVYATTYGSGPFHPAIANDGEVYYWPNITYPTEDEAFTRADKALADAIAAADAVVNGWNIWRA